MRSHQFLLTESLSKVWPSLKGFSPYLIHSASKIIISLLQSWMEHRSHHPYHLPHRFIPFAMPLPSVFQSVFRAKELITKPLGDGFDWILAHWKGMLSARKPLNMTLSG